MLSFIEVAADSDFSIHNLPFGIFIKDGHHIACTRIGDTIVDLHQCAELGLFDNLHLPHGIFRHTVLNAFIGLGKKVTSAVRTQVQQALTIGGFLDNEKFNKTDISFI